MVNRAVLVAASREVLIRARLISANDAADHDIEPNGRLKVLGTLTINWTSPKHSIPLDKAHDGRFIARPAALPIRAGLATADECFVNLDMPGQRAAIIRTRHQLPQLV